MNFGEELIKTMLMWSSEFLQFLLFIVRPIGLECYIKCMVTFFTPNFASGERLVGLMFRSLNKNTNTTLLKIKVYNQGNVLPCIKST